MFLIYKKHKTVNRSTFENRQTITKEAKMLQKLKSAIHLSIDFFMDGCVAVGEGGATSGRQRRLRREPEGSRTTSLSIDLPSVGQDTYSASANLWART